MDRIITVTKIYENKYRDPAKAKFRYYTILDEYGNKYSLFDKGLLTGVRQNEKYQIEIIPSGKYLNVQSIVPMALATPSTTVTSPLIVPTSTAIEPHPILDPQPGENEPDIPFDNAPEAEESVPEFDNEVKQAENEDKQILILRQTIIKALGHLFSGQKEIPGAADIVEYAKILEEYVRS